ncbi:MAG: D-aminoacylase [Bacteroidetes bacterium]|nr:D-aminoacylase [Bacteroidota bacterium]
MRSFPRFLLAFMVLFLGCADPDYDVIISGGSIYDGNGNDPVQADLGIRGDSIAFIGDLSTASARKTVDATGMAVTPGFINMLSWATGNLVKDGRSMGDIAQGVTLEVFGEGWSEGPLNESMKKEGTFEVDVRTWTTIREYLAVLEKGGISTNVASFVGATTVRIHELGYENRPPTAEELDRMKGLVRQAMEEGAMGLGSSLIYAPAFYASTEELIELAKVVSEYDGMYISHMRSEGNRLLEAIEELITISREAGVRAEVYHLKAAGEANWPKMDQAIERIERARSEGQEITADMYTYIAGATGLDAHMPPWVQEGGFAAWRARLMDPEIRAKVLVEMRTPTNEWENLGLGAGPEGVMVVGFEQDSLRYLIGKTLAELALERGTTPEDVAIDLVIADSTRVGTVYFLMSEDNLKKQIALPWVSFDSDAESMAPEGENLKNNPHPRAYGTFARLLAKYVREEGVITLQEAIRKLTSLPADNLRLARRGRLQVGHYADIAIFNPAEIQDHATFSEPHQLATGMSHVFVNGTQVFENGIHTGAFPGRAVLRGEK